MPAFHPVSNNKLYIQIYNQIRQAIEEGTFKAGDKLPSEKELCRYFGVSRVPVREALCALELNGLVESSQGMGVFVKAVHAVTNDWIQEIEPQDIIQCRKVLEPEVARCAALNMDEAEKQRLREIMDRFRAEAEAEWYNEDTDRDFHMSIARGSKNNIYVVLYEMIWKAMKQDLWNLILKRSVIARQSRKQHFEEHMLVAESILDGDADRAYNKMKSHMEELERRYWADASEEENAP